MRAAAPYRPFLWLGLQLVALWPQWQWYGRRLADGSDEPVGIFALLALLLLVARAAPRLRREPDPRWIAVAAVMAVFNGIAVTQLPALLSSVVGMLSLAAGLAAWLPARTPRLPYAGLLLLSLPLLSSLQFYAGYPLRLVTAQLSCWMLQLGGLTAGRSGASLVVNGRLVIVDAPCSGITMAWMAYFAAFAMSGICELRDRTLLRRLPLVGLLVLGGNTLRNTILVAWEASGRAPSAPVHEAIGLLALGAVCLVVLKLMKTENAHALAGPV